MPLLHSLMLPSQKRKLSLSTSAAALPLLMLFFFFFPVLSLTLLINSAYLFRARLEDILRGSIQSHTPKYLPILKIDMLFKIKSRHLFYPRMSSLPFLKTPIKKNPTARGSDPKSFHLSSLKMCEAHRLRNLLKYLSQK